MRAYLATAFLTGSLTASLAQGTIVVDDTVSAYGLAANAPGSANWYSGTFGMEVWELNSTSVPTGLNLDPSPGSGVRAYEAMVADGLSKEAKYSQATATTGEFSLGELLIPTSPRGGTVVLALAAWNTADPSWNAMLANANPGTRAGVVAFLQPTSLPDGGVPPTPQPLFMDRDLVMTAIPEPCVPALAAFGVVLLLYSRRLAALAHSK